MALFEVDFFLFFKQKIEWVDKNKKIQKVNLSLVNSSFPNRINQFCINF